MDDATRGLIRRLYFIEQRPVRVIGAALALSPHAVRSALVLPGGRRDERVPGPVADAVAAEAPSRACHLVSEARR